MQVTIISNPISGRKRHTAHLKVAQEVLRAHGVYPEIRETSQRGDARIFAQQEVVRGTQIVLAAGGDGTINEVANGLAGSSVSLAILPLGTANVFALETRIPSDPVAAVEILFKGSAHYINLGHISCREISGEDNRGSYFLLMAGVGFDGGVLHKIKRENISKWGKAAYIATALQVLSRHTYSRLSIRIDQQDPVSGYSVVIGNARYYGGKFQVTPHASLTEANLDVCVFTRRGPLAMLKTALRVFQGTHLGDTGTLYCKAKTVEITSSDVVYAQADGDFLGTIPAYLTVKEKALSVLVPN